MIDGIGVDIVEVDRFRGTMKKFGNRFVKKIFTDLEIRYCTSKKNSYQHFAARFAAKEAVAKAMSTGWSGAFRWRDVEVSNDDSGKPSVVLYGVVRKNLKRNRVKLSISHTKNIVVAFAVIEAVKG